MISISSNAHVPLHRNYSQEIFLYTKILPIQDKYEFVVLKINF